jgi:hypothetical protein
MYQRKLLLKPVNFGPRPKVLSNETVDAYFHRFHRFHELLDEIYDAEEPISSKSAMRHFIFTLGPECETIQKNYHV